MDYQPGASKRRRWSCGNMSGCTKICVGLLVATLISALGLGAASIHMHGEAMRSQQEADAARAQHDRLAAAAIAQQTVMPREVTTPRPTDLKTVSVTSTQYTWVTRTISDGRKRDHEATVAMPVSVTGVATPSAFLRQPACRFPWTCCIIRFPWCPPISNSRKRDHEATVAMPVSVTGGATPSAFLRQPTCYFPCCFIHFPGCPPISNSRKRDHEASRKRDHEATVGKPIWCIIMIWEPACWRKGDLAGRTIPDSRKRDDEATVVKPPWCVIIIWHPACWEFNHAARTIPDSRKRDHEAAVVKPPWCSIFFVHPICWKDRLARTVSDSRKRDHEATVATPSPLTHPSSCFPLDFCCWAPSWLCKTLSTRSSSTPRPSSAPGPSHTTHVVHPPPLDFPPVPVVFDSSSVHTLSTRSFSLPRPSSTPVPGLD